MIHKIKLNKIILFSRLNLAVTLAIYFQTHFRYIVVVFVVVVVDDDDYDDDDFGTVTSNRVTVCLDLHLYPPV